MTSRQFDVVVSGASIAGCTAAMLYARRGLRVALLETHHDPAHYKRACTHFIQATATPTLRRLGVLPAVEAAGGVPNRLDIWTPWGWIVPDPPAAGAERGYNIRRQALDPVLRAAAAAEPGVTLLSGHRVVRLLHDGSRYSGVLAETRDGVQAFPARLVVGADGRHSAVARLSGVATTERPHRRFVYFAAYEGVRLSSPEASQMWLLDPDVAYAFANGDVTVLSVMPIRDKLADFRRDIPGSVDAALRRLPDAPDLSRARRITPFTGVTGYACVQRRPVAPGVSLIGDAAMVSDYLWGTGCSFAFLTAEWLVDATGDQLGRGPAALDGGLAAYERLHRSRLIAHQWLMSDYAGGRALNAAERLVLSAAARDRRTANRLHRFSERSVGPAHLFAPSALARCVEINRRYRLGRELPLAA